MTDSNTDKTDETPDVEPIQPADAVEDELTFAPPEDEIIEVVEPPAEEPLVLGEVADDVPVETGEAAPVDEPAPVEPEPADDLAAPVEAPVVEAAATEEPPAEEITSEETDDSEDFESLVEDYMGKMEGLKSGAVLQARLVEVHREYVLVDIGDKAEAMINIAEFVDANGDINVTVGDVIPVLMTGRDNETDLAQVSYKRAKEQQAWDVLRKAHEEGAAVVGTFAKVIKGGLEVDFGVSAFCPASHADIHRVEDLETLIGQSGEFAVLELNVRRRRLVVSRRAHLEAERGRLREEVLATLEEGEERKVVIRNIREFGVFCDLGGIDGLIPREELSWDRGAPSASQFVVGDEIRVLVLKVDRENDKITLSRKRTKPDPWDTIEEQFAVDSTVMGKVVTVTSFGAFVYLAEGITGLLHISDLTWDKGAKNVTDYVNEGDQVKVVILEINKEKRQLALGYKQTTMDPWLEAVKQFPEGSRHTGRVTSVAKFGAFVRLTEGVEGLIHISDMTWDRSARRPEDFAQPDAEVEVEVLKVDTAARRMSLSLKHLQENPWEVYVHQHPTGSVVEGKVTRLNDFGAFIELAPGIDGLLHVSQISEDRVERPDQVLKEGESVTVLITKVDIAQGKISLSIREHLKRQEKETLKSFMTSQGSQHGGHNLGDLLRNAAISLDDDTEDKSE